MIADQTLEKKRNAFGVVPMSPMDFSPPGNQNIVYNPANRPSQPGAFLPGQTISDLTFVSGYSQRRIRITMNPGDNPTQQAGSIAIINDAGDIFWIAGNNDDGGVADAIQVINPPADKTGLQIIGADDATQPLVELQMPDPSTAVVMSVVQNSLTANAFQIFTNGGYPFRTQDINPAGGTFARIGNFINGPVGSEIGQAFLLLSDGTNPNGIVDAPLGSICLRASGTGQIAYNNNDGTGWTLL